MEIYLHFVKKFVRVLLRKKIDTGGKLLLWLEVWEMFFLEM